MECTIYVVKTKVLIPWAVTLQLICAFVFAYAKTRFSHDKLICEKNKNNIQGSMAPHYENTSMQYTAIFHDCNKSCRMTA